MNKQVFRQASLDRMASPEQLKDYLHVTTPSLWAVLGAIFLLLIGITAWCFFATVESRMEGTAEVSQGVLVITLEDEKAQEILQEGMSVEVGEQKYPLLSLGLDQEGRTIGVARTDLPDGTYQGRVPYQSTSVLKAMFF